MFSKELQMMDRNNVIYMMDEYEAKVENLTEKNQELATKNEELSTKNENLSTENSELKDALKKYKEKYGDI